MHVCVRTSSAISASTAANDAIIAHLVHTTQRRYNKAGYTARCTQRTHTHMHIRTHSHCIALALAPKKALASCLCMCARVCGCPCAQVQAPLLRNSSQKKGHDFPFSSTFALYPSALALCLRSTLPSLRALSLCPALRLRSHLSRALICRVIVQFEHDLLSIIRFCIKFPRSTAIIIV